MPWEVASAKDGGASAAKELETPLCWVKLGVSCGASLGTMRMFFFGSNDVPGG